MSPPQTGARPGIAAHRLLRGIAVLLVVLHFAPASARDLAVTAGRGAQPGARQFNRMTSVDYTFYTFERSVRQHVEIGVAYTRVSTDALSDTQLYAVSVFPQLTFYPGQDSRLATRAPPWAEPYFFVRALGPSYLSANRLGERQQANNFSFLAQIGAGVLIDFDADIKVNVGVSWKHFSNANLFDDNDGLDVPLVLSIGVRF